MIVNSRIGSLGTSRCSRGWSRYFENDLAIFWWKDIVLEFAEEVSSWIVVGDDHPLSIWSDGLSHSQLRRTLPHELSKMTLARQFNEQTKTIN